MNKSFKFGFTLVEVLVAMTIVGVIAAFVIPPLIAGAQNKKHAASLGRSVELIETGCQMLVQDMNDKYGGGFEGYFYISKNMDGTASNGPGESIMSHSEFFDYSANYFDFTPLDDSDTAAYKKSVHSYDGSNPIPAIERIAEKFYKNSNLGAYYGVRSLKEDTDPEQENHILMKEWLNLVYIDVNGPSSPNRYGRDIFLFNLSSSCHMIPAGTKRLKDMSIPLAIDACNGNSIKNGLSCTARVVRDGYKIEYSK